MDLAIWADVWNNHTISSRVEAHRTPIWKYTHGLVTQGVRGGFAPVAPQDPDLQDDDAAAYGVDWDDLDTRDIYAHFRENNGSAEEGADPFVANQPEHLAHVEIPDVHCPFTMEQVTQLDAYLEVLPNRHTPDFNHRTVIWREGLLEADRIWRGQ